MVLCWFGSKAHADLQVFSNSYGIGWYSIANVNKPFFFVQLTDQVCELALNFAEMIDCNRQHPLSFP